MRLGMVLCLATICVATASYAAFTDDFDTLRAEIAYRSLALSNSTDKIEQKQKKACDKTLAAIDKPATSLVTDIKTAKKVATAMLKTFPNEFIAVNAGGITFTNNMFNLVFGTYTNLGTDVYAEIVTLGGLIAGLPDGPDKLKAAAQFTIATNLLALAQPPFVTSFAQASALLGKSLKAALKGQAIANNAGGGGGGTNNTFVADVQIGGGTNDHFVATLLGEPNFTVSTSTLDLNGSRGTFIQGDDVTAALCSSFNGAPGTYPLSAGCGGYFQYGTPNASYSTVTGTLHIATFNVTITGAGTNASTSGTFAFTGSDGVTTATVTNGQFDLSNVIVFP